MAGVPDAEDELTFKLFSEWIHKTIGFDILDLDKYGDDWTFIVKLHAMIETGLNSALSNHFNEPSLMPVIAKLNTSDAAGKVAFAKALKILLPHSATFIQALSELRNYCVHDIRHFDFDLATYLKSLSDDKRKDFIKKVHREIIEEKRAKVTDQRVAVLIATMSVMLQLFCHDQQCRIRDLQNRINELEEERRSVLDQSTPKE